MRSSSSVYRAYDAIAAVAPGDARIELQQLLGINYNEHGILHCPRMRLLFRPIEHSLRDPMHVLVSNGVGNAHVCQLVVVLKTFGITLGMLQSWIGSFTLPHRHGKVKANVWLNRKRFGKKWDGFASFAGIMLSLLPLLLGYLHSIIDVDDTEHSLFAHYKCFELLVHIVGVCFLGPDDAMQHKELLQRLIVDYIRSFSQLYPDHATPKLHQMLHLVGTLHKLLSCFVTERKHRATKRAALFVFRHVDNTVITSMVNQQCDVIQHNVNSLMYKIFLVSPTTFTLAGIEVSKSREAVLSCGHLRIDDLLYLQSHKIGKAVGFWSFPAQMKICVQVEIHEPVRGHDDRFQLQSSEQCIVESTTIVDAVAWSGGRDYIFIIRPFRVVLGDIA